MLSQVPDQTVLEAVDELKQAGKVFVVGVGHSGLIARTFSMKLNHVGLESYTVYDEINPPFKPGDCLVAVSQSGSTATVLEMARKARKLGGRVLGFVGSAEALLSELADRLVVVPPISEGSVVRELAPFGNAGARNVRGAVFGLAIYVLFYAVTAQLAYERGESPESIDSRHANLE
jgi:6-phospho-3-hexuloisomerase